MSAVGCAVSKYSRRRSCRRIALGAVVWIAFLVYVFVLGGRAARAGDVGDVADRAGMTETVPYAG